MSNYKTLIDWSAVRDEVFTAAETTFLAKFPAESQAIAAAAFKTLVDPKLKRNIKDIAISLDYVGFNPILILQEFAKKAANQIDEGTFEIRNESNEVILTIPKKGDVVIDLAIMVLVFATRGASVEKILRKVSDDWKSALDFKFKAYGITAVRKKGSLDPKDITLGRLAGCVPQFVVALMKMDIGRLYIPYSAYCEAFGMTYPKCVLTQTFSGMVPTSGVGSQFIEHCYFYAFQLDMVINPSRKITDYKAYLNEINNYVNATHKSTLYSDEYRRWVLEFCGLITKKPSGWEYTEIGDRVRLIGSELWMRIDSAFTKEVGIEATKMYFQSNPMKNIVLSRSPSPSESEAAGSASGEAPVSFLQVTPLSINLATEVTTNYVLSPNKVNEQALVNHLENAKAAGEVVAHAKAIQQAAKGTSVEAAVTTILKRYVQMKPSTSDKSES